MNQEILKMMWPDAIWWHYAHNGVIGERMSYMAPKAQWEALRTAGIRHIIDVRYKYSSGKFETRCRKYGIEYFYYPVHNDPETIDNMVKNYQRFSELIADGDFLMMGRTHGLVALAIYWSFSKSPGYYPMELRNYVRTYDRVMNKAVPIMHAMAKAWGKEFALEWGENDEFTKVFTNEKYKGIEKLTQQEYPEKLSLSFVDFTRYFRNGDVVYDISVEGLGVLGYLYPKGRSSWAYDIIMHGWSESGTTRSFEQAQHEILCHLCSHLPHSVKFVALPPAMKMTILLMKEHLNC